MSSNRSLEGRVQATCLQLGPHELSPARYCDWHEPGKMWALPGQRKVKQGGYGAYVPILVTEEEALKIAKRNGWSLRKTTRPRWAGVVVKRC